jgi:hypothetical protein
VRGTAIAASIASIARTHIISTRVNPEEFRRQRHLAAITTNPEEDIALKCLESEFTIGRATICDHSLIVLIPVELQPSRYSPASL